VNATHSKEEFGPENILDNNVRSFWTTEDFQEQAALTIDLGSIKEFDVIMIREAIKEGQRIESFEIDIKEQGQWKTVVMAETMGNKRLFRFDQLLKTDTIRVRINASRFAPTISEFGIYKEAWK